MPANAGQVKEVRRLENLPAGSYVLEFSANAYSGSTQGRYAICTMKVNGDARAMSSAVVGIAAHAVQEVAVPIQTTITKTAPFAVTVDCYQDQSGGTNPDVIIVRAQLLATHVGTVTTAP